MIDLIIVLLVLSWVMGGGLGGLGFAGFHGGFGGGGLIHTLLVLACVVLVLRIMGVRI